MGYPPLENSPIDSVNAEIADHRTDAQIAAAAAVYAFRAGRVRLGFSFSRIAMQAQNEHDSAAQLPPGPIWEDAHRAQTDMFGNDEQARRLNVPESTRCIGRTIRDGANVECHAVIVWQEEQRDGGNAVIRPRGWYHLHAHLDSDHDAVPTQIASQQG